MEQKLFGTSGIRKIANVELTPTLAVKIGLAVATLAERQKVAVAHDTRTTSDMLEHAVTAGLLAGGATVQKLGLIPTPALAYLTWKLGADTGVMITASHNPPEYNGIKLFNKDTTSYSGEQQDRIEEIIKNGGFRRQPWDKIRKVSTLNRMSLYVEMVQNAVKLEKKWRVVLDPGCGATSHIAPMLFHKLGCKVTVINAQPDGFFPGRKPLPDAESLQPLSKIVKQLHADIGIAYDGDGDRMVTIDEKGMLTSLDQILAAYAAYLVKKNKGGVVVTHVEASACIESMVNSLGGKVFRTKVGDTNVAAAIKQKKAIFGGEPCGAWIHPQHHYCPDGILSSLLVLKALEEEGKTLSAFVSEAPRYAIIRKAVECPDNVKVSVLKKLEDTLPTCFPDVEEKLTIDGVRLKFKDGWLLVRLSGTEPLIRITVEAENKERTEEIMKKAIRLVNKLVKERA